MRPFLVAVLGYLLGSLPIANLVAGRRAAIDLRTRGDRNPGYWNAKATLGRRAALPVFAGDVAKGAAAAGVGALMMHGSQGGNWWLPWLGGLAAMIGHAWPVFARFRGGRSVLCFVGTMLVAAPLAAVVALAICGAVWAVTRRFDWAARVGVFGFPFVEAMFDPLTRVAATGVLMTFIGIRFGMAALADRRDPGHAVG
ncbi:MAG: glycerol-3-phosphate acyltransferase [Ilumatobacteraceae bacterium]